MSNHDNRILAFIAKSASGTFALRLFYLASGFITTLLLTRWLGADLLGVYNYVISWILLTGIFVKFGLEDYITREIAAFRNTANYGEIKALWNFTVIFILVSSTVAVAIYSGVLSQIEFAHPNLKTSFWLSLILIPLLSLLGIYRGLFRGTKNIISSQLPEYVIRPAQTMLLAGTVLLFSVTAKPEYAILITASGTLTALLFCIFRNPVKHAIRTTDSAKSSTSAWVWGAFPFLLIAGIHIFNQRTDRLMLGTMLNMKNVGIYSVAIQMALVVNSPMVGIRTAIGPLIAERHKVNRQFEVQSALINATTVATGLSALIVLSLVFLGPYVLNIFGNEFGDGYMALIILALGQFANVASGPAGAILSMSGQEKLVALGVLISALLNIVLNFLLIPTLEITGAALATAISMTVWNILLVAFTKWSLGVDSTIFARFIPNVISLERHSKK